MAGVTLSGQRHDISLGPSRSGSHRGQTAKWPFKGGNLSNESKLKQNQIWTCGSCGIDGNRVMILLGIFQDIVLSTTFKGSATNSVYRINHIKLVDSKVSIVSIKSHEFVEVITITHYSEKHFYKM